METADWLWRESEKLVGLPPLEPPPSQNQNQNQTQNPTHNGNGTQNGTGNGSSANPGTREMQSVETVVVSRS